MSARVVNLDRARSRRTRAHGPASSFKDMSDAAVKCRVLRHAWEPRITTIQPRNRIELILDCLRCETVKAVLIHRRTGEREATVYRYPDGYLVQGPIKSWGGRSELTRNALLVMIKRMDRRPRRRT